LQNMAMLHAVFGCCYSSSSLNNLSERFYREYNEKCDSLIFGPSQIPYNKKTDGCLLFYPGSVSGNSTFPFSSLAEF
jgi:predicted phosphodiesterase